MKTSQFLIIVAAHTLLPLIVGVILFLGSVAIGSSEKHLDTDSNAIAVRQGAPQRAVLAVGLIMVVAIIGIAGQLVPCLFMAVILAFLAAWLVPSSKVLYVVLGTVIGTSGAAVWFLYIGPGGLHAIGGMLTIFAGIGYLISGSVVCHLKNI
jgi:hypothetical protein